MSAHGRSRHLPSAVAVTGVIVTLIAAVSVVVVGRTPVGSDLVAIERSELLALEAASRDAASGDEAPYRLDEIARLDTPTALAARPGSDDLYVALLGGVVQRLTPTDQGDYEVANRPVTDVSSQVSAQPGLEGLVGITFSPDGSTMFLAYIDKARDQVVSAHLLSDGGRVAAQGTPVITVDRPDGMPPNNHIGGSLAFGPDGYLYIGVGDAGAGAFSAPDPGSFFGKILRIEPTAGGGYRTPTDNPFSGERGLPEVWTTGMRNPFRIDFDSATGDLWVADVGEEALEEVNRLGADEGAGRSINLGWPQYAGSSEYRTDQPSPTELPHTPPSYEYDHREGRCAVVGGEVYRGGELPDLTGSYLFADVCGKALLGLRGAADGGYEEFTLATVDEAQMVSIDAGPDGEIYLVSTSGGVYRLTAA